jgi:hypothetical protein
MAYSPIWPPFAPWPHRKAPSESARGPDRAGPAGRHSPHCHHGARHRRLAAAKEKDMAESSVSGQTPEEIALKLLYVVSWGENIDLEAWGKADRKWILDTYAECLLAVRDPAARLARATQEDQGGGRS